MAGEKFSSRESGKSCHAIFFCLPKKYLDRFVGARLMFWSALLVLLFCWLFPAPVAAFWPFTAWGKNQAADEAGREAGLPKVNAVTPLSPKGQADNQALKLRWEIAAIANDLLASLADFDHHYGDLSGGVIVLSFVDQRNLAQTTSLGRYLAEQLMHELQQRRVPVLELRKSTEVRVQERGGEFGLSRNPAEIRDEVAASAMLTGTYTVTAAQIIVNARVIDHKTTILLASATAVINRTPVVEALLADPVSIPRARAQSEPMYLQRLEL